MKSIAIVGAGIGGCTTYLFLKKHLSPVIPNLSIHIYESYPPPPYLSSSHPDAGGPTIDPAGRPNQHATTDVTTALGGALGLSPNGIRVLESLDPAICAQLKAASYEVESFAIQLSSGRSLGAFNAGGERHGHGTLLIMRATVHDAVLERVDKNDISFRKEVRGVVDADEAAQIEFEDGTKVEADLVIGADGVWGKTRLAIPESAELKAEYDGMVGVGAFFDEETTRRLVAQAEPKKDLVIPETIMTMTFGNGSFVGTIIDKKLLDGQPTDGKPLKARDPDRDIPFAGYWCTFPMEPAPTSRTPFPELKEQLLIQHKNWTPLIPAMIENSGLGNSATGTFVLPRWITPSLPRWTGHCGRVLLVGDAAHCMPPDSGQGVSCAVEDAMTIGLLCEAIFAPSISPEDQTGEETTEQEKLKRLCDLYTKVRKPRCDYIVAEARKRGDMKRELSWWEEMVRNAAIWTMCKILPKSSNDAFFSWDVQAEVKKALAGEIPAAMGRGSVA